MKTPANRGRWRAGMTLVELSIAMVLSGLAFLAVARTTSSTTSTYRTGTAEDTLRARAHRSLSYMTQRLVDAGVAGLTPQPTAPLGASGLTFRRNRGWAGGVTWGEQERFEFQYAEGEIDDGIDNDGNGLVDDGVLVYVQRPGQPDEVRTVRGRGVAELLEGEAPNVADDNGNGLEDEQGLSFELQGRVLTIRLTVQGTDHDGRLLTKTVETSVRIRN